MHGATTAQINSIQRRGRCLCGRPWSKWPTSVSEEEDEDRRVNEKAIKRGELAGSRKGKGKNAGHDGYQSAWQVPQPRGGNLLTASRPIKPRGTLGPWKFLFRPRRKPAIARPCQLGAHTRPRKFGTNRRESNSCLVPVSPCLAVRASPFPADQGRQQLVETVERSKPKLVGGEGWGGLVRRSTL